MNLRIRKPEYNELPEVARITRLSFKMDKKMGLPAFREDGDWKKKYKDGNIGILIAVSGDKIIGTMRHHSLYKNALYLYALAVLKSFRNRGVGSTLIRASEKIAKRRHLKRMLFSTALPRNLVPHYKKLGYKIKLRLSHAGNEHVYMYKNLDSAKIISQ